MNRIIQTCFCLRDDQISKYGHAYAIGAFATGTFLIATAILIVVRFGLHPEPIQTRISDISGTLVQHANATSSESGTVIQTSETRFLQKLQSVITKLPFIAGVLLLSLGTLLFQCGLMYRKLILQIEKVPNKTQEGIGEELAKPSE